MRYSLLAVSLGGCSASHSRPVPARTTLEAVKQQIHLKGPSPLTAGTARVEITPPVGTPLAGYSKRKGRPSTGVRDPLYVRALAVSDGEDRVVLVSADLLIFPPPMAEALLKRLSDELKLPRQAIVLAATHTHSGAGAIAPGFLYEILFGPYRPEGVEGIIGRTSWAVRQALEKQQPVQWGTGAAEGILAGLTENRMVPGGPVDPDLQMLLIGPSAGKPLAVLVNCAAHPTLLDSEDRRFSADYPGELARLIEATYPGAVCLFMNGMAGDLRPRDAIGATPDERVSRFGGALAEIATGLASRISMNGKGDLSAWGWRIPLPPPQLHLGPIPIHPQIGKWIRPTSAYLNLIALDQMVFVPLSAEMTTELGSQLKQRLAGEGMKPFLLGYANGYLGYTVTPQQYENGSYEAWMTWYGPDFGVSLIGQIQQFADLHEQKRSK